VLVDNNSADIAKKLTILLDEEIARFDSILSDVQEYFADYNNSSNYLNGGFN
jgi:hypothetical protein